MDVGRCTKGEQDGRCFHMGLVYPGLAAQLLRGLSANGTFLVSAPSSQGWSLHSTPLPFGSSPAALMEADGSNPPLDAIEGPLPTAFHQVLSVLSDPRAFAYAVLSGIPSSLLPQNPLFLSRSAYCFFNNPSELSFPSPTFICNFGMLLLISVFLYLV